jgi:hypothetical protein
MKNRKPYEKPAVVFEKELEAMAGVCDPDGNRLYGGTVWTCKAAGFCINPNS